MNVNLQQYLGLINNAALLLALGLLYDMLIIRSSADPGMGRRITGGFLAGFMGISVMLTPWELSPGVFFDTLSVLLCSTGLFFGTIPALIAALMTAALRVFQGGGGVYMGTGVIAASASIGIIWRYFRKPVLHKISFSELFLMGATVHLAMISLTVLLPEGSRMKTFAAIAMPTMLIYPAGTAVFGKILSARIARRLAEDKLQESEARYRGYVDNAPTGVFISNSMGRYVLVNRAACEITGWSENELLSMGIPDMAWPDSPGEGLEHFKQVIKKGYGSIETPFRHRDGSKKIWRVDAVQISDDRFMGFVTDITEKIKTREKIAEALREKEILLRELYHRTKNNMQVIRSIIILQSSTSDNPEVKKIAAEIDSKIHAMALVHQMLYQSGNLSSINLKEYIHSLSETIIQSVAVGRKQIELTLSIADIPVNIDLAIPFGLVINELLTNTVKYAFPEEDNGKVEITINRIASDTVEMTYRDSGIGVAPDFDFGNGKTVGLASIKAIVEHQLQGYFEIFSADGFNCRIRVSDRQFTERI
jgi:PAS domain S-box-containing protein